MKMIIGARRTYIPRSGIYFPKTKHVEILKKPRWYPIEKMVEAIKDARKYFEIV